MLIDAARVQATLLELLRTPSFSGEEVEVAALVESRLRSMGLAVERDDAGSTFGGNCGNLIARVPGTVRAEPIFLNSHLDTVQPTHGLDPVIADGVVRSNGSTILGADDKAGVTAILEGIRHLLESDSPRPPVELVFTVGEETGMHGARALDLSRIEAPLGFVFDSGTPIGEMTISAPTQASQRIELHGLAAHAGVEPEKGINAIACAAAAIARCRQGRIDAETTCNIGVIEGGQATNIVADLCRLRSEVRSRDLAKLTRQVAHLQECFETAATEFGCRLEFANREAYRGFRIDPDEPIARLAAAAVAAAGESPSFAEGGGGSDANIFNAGGKRCILMACGERDPHTLKESVAVADVVAATRVVTELVRLAGEMT